MDTDFLGIGYMLMLPGLALFYGGMVRRKNVLAALMHSFIPLGVITVQWVLFGYSLAFDNDIGHFIGDLSKALFMEIDFKTLSGTIPEYLFSMFQLMFAIITAALIKGSFDWAHEKGYYLGVWGSNVDFGEGGASAGQGASTEFDFYAGVARQYYGIDIDVGYLFYTYPGAKNS